MERQNITIRSCPWRTIQSYYRRKYSVCWDYGNVGRRSYQGLGQGHLSSTESKWSWDSVIIEKKQAGLGNKAINDHE